MKTAILSDIHGNREALSVILDSVKKSGAESIIILGDIIDYGPHSDEVIEMIKEIPLPLICN
ncbi:MAG: metallophosphoesterase family protein, partial [Oscillospiraceae bacterium]|nr:metallophosphoesterase family protein [Oscillospiraceae bacterium]